MATYQSALKSTKKFGISGTVLKLIAMFSMFLDHFALIIIKNGKLYGYSGEYYQMAIATPEGQKWLKIYEILRLFGMFAFPIFAFLLVEGFIHTSDFWKYFRRVLIMAVFAELPYDLALFNETYNFSRQNTGWTLVTALLVLYCMKKFRSNTAMKWCSVAAGAAAAEFLHFDYGALGIIMMALMYNFRKETLLRVVSGAVLTGVQTYESWCLGALAFIPIYFYNGERGRLRMKWFPYLFYPLHLIVLYLMIYVGAMITT